MALGRTVSCSQKTVSALRQSCKNSEYDKRYSYSSPFYLICLHLSHVSKVSVADTRAPALWMGLQMQIFFLFGGFYEDQYEDQQWLCPNIPSYLDSTTAWCPSALCCYSRHFLWKSSLLLAALQTHSQQLHSNSNEQKTATLNVARTDTV